MSRDIWEARSPGAMTRFTYSCPKTYQCMLLSSFTDYQSSGKWAISNHVSFHLHPQVSHSSSTKRCMPVWTCGKDKNSTILHALPKPMKLLPFCLCSGNHLLFHVYLACGKRGQHPGTHFLTPGRHWKSLTGDGSLRTCWPIPFQIQPFLKTGELPVPRLVLWKSAAWLPLPWHTDVQGIVAFLPTGHCCILKFLPLFMQEPLTSPFFWM